MEESSKDNAEILPPPPPPPTGTAVAASAVEPHSFGENQLPPPSYYPESYKDYDRLRAEDGLKYVNYLKTTLGAKSKVFMEFLKVMEDYKAKRSKEVEVIDRVVHLFRDRDDLLEGFAYFLPNQLDLKAYLEVHPSRHQNFYDEQLSQASITTGLTSTEPMMTSSTSPETAHDMLEAVPSGSSSLAMDYSPVSNSNNGPDEVAFVNKVKDRFQLRPEKYNEFIDIVLTYRKELNNAKEGKVPLVYRTDAQLYADVKNVFKDDQDLLLEFCNYLPVSEEIMQQHESSVPCPPYSTSLANNENSSSDFIIAREPKRPYNRKVGKKCHINKLTRRQLMSRLRPRPDYSLVATEIQKKAKAKKKAIEARRRMKSESETSTNRLQQINNSRTMNGSRVRRGRRIADEAALFNQVRQTVSSSENYNTFCLSTDLYISDLISSTNLFDLAESSLSKNPKLLVSFKRFVEQQKRKLGSIPATINWTRKRYIYKKGGGCVYKKGGRKSVNKLRRLGSSYYCAADLFVEKQALFSYGAEDVLNNTWVSTPVWSEDFQNPPRRRTQTEATLNHYEDERFQMDMAVETLKAATVCLDAVTKKMSEMAPEALENFHLDDNFGGTTILHQATIKNLYGDAGWTMIRALKRDPVVVVPVVLKRLKAKLQEFTEIRRNYQVWDKRNLQKYLDSILDLEVPLRSGSTLAAPAPP